MKKIRQIYSSQFFKSISQLTTGAFLAQLITIIVAPISTRLYTPEELGVYTLILTFVSIFGPVLNGKYDLAIVTAKDEKEVAELIVGSALFSIVLIFVITLGYTYYLKVTPEILTQVGVFAYILIGILLIRSCTNILNSYNNRYKEYKIMSTVYVLRTGIQNVGLILFGLLKFGSIGLLISQLLGALFGLKKQGEHLYRNRDSIKEVQFSKVKKTLKRYIKQPLYSMPAHFLNSTSYSILNFFISGLFGMRYFGYYSMSYRILGLPLNLISMNVSKVFFQRASEEQRNIGSYNKTLKQVTIFLSCISIPMVIFLILLGPYMFEFVFGEGWNVSGIFVQILAPMYGIRFIVSALTPALIISGKQKLELMIQSLFIISSVISFLVSKLLGFNIYVFLTLITITYSVIYTLFYVVIYKLSKQKIEEI